MQRLQILCNEVNSRQLLGQEQALGVVNKTGDPIESGDAMCPYKCGDGSAGSSLFCVWNRKRYPVVTPS
jgi:hypothetical protein